MRVAARTQAPISAAVGAGPPNSARTCRSPLTISRNYRAASPGSRTRSAPPGLAAKVAGEALGRRQRPGRENGLPEFGKARALADHHAIRGKADGREKQPKIGAAEGGQRLLRRLRRRLVEARKARSWPKRTLSGRRLARSAVPSACLEGQASGHAGAPALSSDKRGRAIGSAPSTVKGVVHGKITKEECLCLQSAGRS